MLVPLKLLQEDGLLLLSHPPLALDGAPQVHRPVPVSVYHCGLLVREVVGVVEGLRRVDAAAVQAVDFHVGRQEVGHQRLRVLPHQPAVIEADVFVEPSVVLHRVVDRGCADQNLQERKWPQWQICRFMSFVTLILWQVSDTKNFFCWDDWGEDLERVGQNPNHWHSCGSRPDLWTRSGRRAAASLWIQPYAVGYGSSAGWSPGCGCCHLKVKTKNKSERKVCADFISPFSLNLASK